MTGVILCGRQKVCMARSEDGGKEKPAEFGGDRPYIENIARESQNGKTHN